MSRPRINFWSWHGIPWNGLRPQDRANENRTTFFALLWIASLPVIRLPVTLFDAPTWVGWGLGAISLVFGWLFARAFIRMLRDADELLRKVQLEALALGCGAGLICGLSFIAATTPSQWSAFAFFLPMSLTYLAHVLMAAQRAVRDTEDAA